MCVRVRRSLKLHSDALLVPGQHLAARHLVTHRTTFAVVASEVKALATQTAKATEEIPAQVAAMQATTNDAVTSIGGPNRR